VIASSGAGKVEHFSEVFEKTKAEAALAAGIFHREEVPIEAVKEHMRERGIETRQTLVAEVSVHIEKAPPDDFGRGLFCFEAYDQSIYIMFF